MIAYYEKENYESKPGAARLWHRHELAARPGAAGTAMRNVVYFNGHGNSHALIVLALDAVLGAAVAMVAYRLCARPGPATVAT